MSSKSKKVLRRTLILGVLAALAWAAGAFVSLRATGHEAAATSLRQDAGRLHQLAARLGATRAEAPHVQVQNMSRAEVNSWAYWESVATRSGIGADRLSLEPVFEEPAEGTGGPTLLTTTVEIRDVPLRQVLSFLYYMAEERPYVGISSVLASRPRPNTWEATIEAFLYFREAQ